MSSFDKGFNDNAFFKSLETVAQTRGKNWKQVGAETGVGASTLTRMAQGKKPDAASLAALSAWAGLNPSDFVEGTFVAPRSEPIAQVSTLLRNDPNLDSHAAQAIEDIFKAAYERLKNKS